MQNHAVPHENTYVIVDRQLLDDQTGQPLFWSNADGWVDFRSSTLFTDQETERLSLPLGNQVEWIPFWAAVQLSELKH